MREDFVQFMSKQVEAQNMKNPSLGEIRSLCQINQVCKEENQRRNLTFNNFAWLCEILQDCEIPKRSACCRIETKAMKNEFCNLAKFSQPCEIVKNKFYNLAKPKLKKMNFATPCEIPLCNLQIFSYRLH